jgi:hypothetical protein
MEIKRKDSDRHTDKKSPNLNIYYKSFHHKGEAGSKDSSIFFFLYLSGATARRGPWPPHSPALQITHNDTLQSVGLLWTGDRSVAETHAHITHKRQTSMPPVRFEPAIPASERPQSLALEGSAKVNHTKIHHIITIHFRQNKQKNNII